MGLRTLCRFRVDLVGQLARVKRKIIGVLDTVFPEYAKVFKNVFGVSSQTILSMACTPEDIAALDLAKLKKIITKTSRRHINPEKAAQVKQAAKNSVGVRFCADAFSMELKSMLAHLKFLEGQIKSLEKEIKAIFKKQETYLTTIPGIADINAAAILSEIGDISNFTKQGGRKLVAFAGLDAKVSESGRHIGKPKMSKRGSPYLRHAVMQSSLIASLHDPFFKKIYQKQIRRGKPHRVAVSHVANKMLHVIHSVLKNDKPYSPVADA
jgi:transposase